MVRAGGVRASVYNDGAVVFLYDVLNRERLVSMNAYGSLVSGEVEHQAKAVKEVEAHRALVVYELQGDHGVEVEVYVGEPLTKKEKSALPWTKDQKTVLRLPSGQLRIESANSCSISPETPSDEGVTVKVPPGDYELTLHRVDFNAEGIPDSAPSEVVVLTPLADMAKVKKAPGFLSWADVSGPLAAWERGWKVAAGQFTGRAKAFGDQILINAPRAAIEKMGLRWGDRLEWSVGDHAGTAVFTSRTTLDYVGMTFGDEKVQAWSQTVRCWASSAMAPSGSIVLGLRGLSDGDLPGLADLQPASIRVCPDPVDRLADLPRLSTSKGAVSTPVLASCPAAVTLDWEMDCLKKAGIGPGTPLRLEIGGVVREVLWENVGADTELRRRRGQVLRAAAGHDPHIATTLQEIVGPCPDYFDDDNARRKHFGLMATERKLVAMPLPPALLASVPLVVRTMPHWDNGARIVLWAQPLVGSVTGVEATVGSLVTVSPVV